MRVINCLLLLLNLPTIFCAIKNVNCELNSTCVLPCNAQSSVRWSFKSKVTKLAYFQFSFKSRPNLLNKLVLDKTYSEHNGTMYSEFKTHIDVLHPIAKKKKNSSSLVLTNTHKATNNGLYVCDDFIRTISVYILTSLPKVSMPPVKCVFNNDCIIRSELKCLFWLVKQGNEYIYINPYYSDKLNRLNYNSNYLGRPNFLKIYNFKYSGTYVCQSKFLMREFVTTAS